VETASGYRGYWPDKGAVENEGPLLLTFPRGIAPLRNAYQAAQEAAKSTEQSQRPFFSLPLSYRQAEWREQEIVAPMARDQTPVSQDAVLRQISQTLDQRGIEVAVVSANELDTLFLLRYLRSSNPDLRIALTLSDVMLARFGDNSDYVGTLLFTHFPLFSGERQKLPQEIEDANSQKKTFQEEKEVKVRSCVAEETFVSVISLL
jgi:hypothetical protein